MRKSKNNDQSDSGGKDLNEKAENKKKKRAAPKKEHTQPSSIEKVFSDDESPDDKIKRTTAVDKKSSLDDYDIFESISFDDIYNLDDIYAEVERRAGEITAGLQAIDAKKIADEERAKLETEKLSGDEALPEQVTAGLSTGEPDDEKNNEHKNIESAEDSLLKPRAATIDSNFSLDEFKSQTLDDEYNEKTFLDNIADKLRPLLSVFESFYNLCYWLGIQSFRYGKRISIRLGRLIMKPWRYFLAFLRIFIISIDRLFFRSIHSIHNEWVYFRREVRASLKRLRHSEKKNLFALIPAFSHYVKKAFTRHHRLFRSMANTALPLAALLIFWLTVNYWNSVTFALKVTYNNHSIGYIEDEAVYIKAETQAKERLNTSSEAIDKTAEVLNEPRYALSLVKLNQLSDDSAICDSLIEYSNSKITNACGIYIDGSFLCAVKNETDATSVFDSILAPYRTRKDTLAAFVEDVKYSQGLYPDTKDSMWDASRLAEKLNTKKKDAVYYTVKDGESDWDIAVNHHLTLNQLKAMNPQMGKYIYEGDKLVISNEVNFLRVKLIKTEKRYANIAYETIKTYNSSRFKGDTRTIRKGVAGKELITESVSYVDNLKIFSKVISRERISDPIPAKVEIGTKSTRVNYSSGSYDVSISNEGFVWPASGCHMISSPYGYRSRGWHDGVDITAHGARGKVIVAAKDGYVESVQYSSYGLGNHVIINHGNGVETEYGHCLSGSISVSPGQHVSAGQPIARIGATGNATGPHLHFNLIVNGTHVNPLPYIS